MKQQSEPALVIGTEGMPLAPPSLYHRPDIFRVQDDVEGTVCSVDVGDLAAPLLRLVDGAGTVMLNIQKKGLLIVHGLEVGWLDLEVLGVYGFVGPEKRPGIAKQ